MRFASQSSNGPSAALTRLAAWSVVFLGTAALFSTEVSCAQCPNTGQTKVVKPSQGTGYYFYKFLGDSSYVYFLDGGTFSLNTKDDPGKSFIAIDDFIYEPLLVDKADIAKYTKSSDTAEILRSQARHQQAYFKSAVPSMVITDYGPSASKNTDGTDGRLFYLWKKESAPGSPAATQYLISTLVKDGVAVLSIMPSKGSAPEADIFSKIEQYTARFDVLSNERCAKISSMPIAR